ncbi:hypothetical protein ABFA07_014166 [Porites harrisoni]
MAVLDKLRPPASGELKELKRRGKRGRVLHQGP